MLMLMQILGKDYIVWDKAAHIDFIKPGKGTVKAIFKVGPDIVSKIKEYTYDGSKYLIDLPVEVKDELGETVTKVVKTIYIRKKTSGQ